MFESYLKIAARTSFIFAFAASLSLVVQCREPDTEILWDHFGVPHIQATGETDMYHAFGWAQMHNHADLILKLYGQARGRASEYWGSEYLETDKLVALMDLTGHAERNFLNQKEPYKSYVEAFARGLNDYAKANPGAITKKYRCVLPVTATDVVAHQIRILCMEFMAGEDLYILKNTMGNGSNACAIDPSRSASGKAMLLTNPHLPWADFFLWIEAHLSCPGFNAYGISLVGTPTLSMAFNDHLGWSFTVNTLDGADRYELILKDGGYLLDGTRMEFEKKSKLIRVLSDNGSVEEQNLECRYSLHGPVIAEKQGKAYALRVAGLENKGIFEEFHKMAAATSLNEFEDALKLLQNPMFNILYADTKGNIMYLFNGNVPRRPSGDYAYWKGTIDGSRSSLIWNEYHAYQDLPRVLNPPSGFLQNCNDPPWTCTYPPVLDPADFPGYMAPQFMHFRAQRAMNLISRYPVLSFDQLVDCKFNTGMEVADRLVDDLLEAVRLNPDPLAVKAAAVLEKWDHSTDQSSRGSILFASWFDRLKGNVFRIPWTASDPSHTPDGLADPAGAVKLLTEAAKEVEQEYGALDTEWGSVHRFSMNGYDYPANGGPGDYGIFRTIGYTGTGDGKLRASFGDTYIAVIEFGEVPRASVLLGYGNATQPGSAHIGDQLVYFSEKKLRPALLRKEDILKNLEKKEIMKDSR